MRTLPLIKEYESRVHEGVWVGAAQTVEEVDLLEYLLPEIKPDVIVVVDDLRAEPTGVLTLAFNPSSTSDAPPGVIMITCESPMREERDMTISSQATEIIEPPEMALGLTQATVLMSVILLIWSAIAMQLCTIPPGVSSSKMMTSAPFALASSIRRLTLPAVTSVISLRIGRITPTAPPMSIGSRVGDSSSSVSSTAAPSSCSDTSAASGAGSASAPVCPREKDPTSSNMATAHSGPTRALARKHLSHFTVIVPSHPVPGKWPKALAAPVKIVRRDRGLGKLKHRVSLE